MTGSAQEWPEFRGPNRSGVAAAVENIPAIFGPATNVGWVQPVPEGRSSPIIKNGRLFITGCQNGRLLVLAFDANTGHKLWEYAISPTRRNEIDAARNDPASPTPAADADGVYVFFHDTGIVALSPAGKLLWTQSFGPFVNNYGMGTSPVIYGETLYLQVDQLMGSFVVALDKRTGRVRWRRDRPDVLEGWSTPLVLADRGELVTLSSSGLGFLDLETGEPRWTIPASQGLMIPSPVADGASIIATIRGSDEPPVPAWKQTLADLDRDGDGRISPDELAKRHHRNSFGIADSDRDGFITESEWEHFRQRGVGPFGITKINLQNKRVVWQQKRGLPYVPSPIVYDGIVYSVRSGGIVAALDLNTGEVVKEGRAGTALGDYFASPVAAGGRLYVANAEGKVAVIKTGRNWDVLNVNDLAEPVYASPAIAQNALYVRTQSRLYCFRQSSARPH